MAWPEKWSGPRRNVSPEQVEALALGISRISVKIGNTIEVFGPKQFGTPYLDEEAVPALKRALRDVNEVVGELRDLASLLEGKA